MSVKELLNPRYKVKGPYPGSRYKIGDIIESLGENRFDLYKDGTTYYNESELKKYPQLFRLMNWWEGQEAEEMKSVKYIRYKEMVFEVEDWGLSFGTWRPMHSEEKKQSELNIYWHFNKNEIIPSTK